MKRLIAILISSFAIFHCVASAGEYDDMFATLEHIQYVRDGLAVRAEVENYIGQRLWYLGATSGFLNAATAYKNTYFWYLWRDFERASGFEKLELGEILEDKQ